MVHQDEGTGVLRPGPGEEQRRRAGVASGQDGGPLGVDLIQDDGQFLGIGFPRRQGVGCERVRGARATPVEED
jgi:hypothetical protein